MELLFELAAILILLERRHLAGQWNISIDSEFEKSAT
jgi:hypothetical protein